MKSGVTDELEEIKGLNETDTLEEEEQLSDQVRNFTLQFHLHIQLWVSSAAKLKRESASVRGRITSDKYPTCKLIKDISLCLTEKNSGTG